VSAFPDPADQVRLVEDGQGAMPSFKGELSQAQIADVVAYTRTELK
jgi:mono/diheme cytochrome c family protein